MKQTGLRAQRTLPGPLPARERGLKRKPHPYTVAAPCAGAGVETQQGIEAGERHSHRSPGGGKG